MRAVSGCVRCRKLHARCELNDASNCCKRCEGERRFCDRRFFVRFRPVTTVYEILNDGRLGKRKITYGRDHKWVKIPKQVTFLEDCPDESPAAEEFDGLEDVVSGERIPLSKDSPSTPGSFKHTSIELQAGRAQPSQILVAIPELDHTFPPHQNLDTLAYAANLAQGLSQPAQVYEEQAVADTARMFFDPFEIGDTPHSLTSLPTLPSSLPRTDPPPSLEDRKQALLLRHFIEYVAPELDVCDPLTHFATEVPQRARYCPILLYAVLALAARHDSVTMGHKDMEEEAEAYYSSCLELLIDVLDEENAIDENVFVTIIVLRLYEERAAADEQHHFFAATGLLNTTTFASSGGLAEAASWITLRQDIYLSITLRQCSKINLANYLNSAVFADKGDSSWTNRIVFQTARVLTAVFQESSEVSCEDWTALLAELEAWNRDKPMSFIPTWPPNYSGKGSDEIVPGSMVFPEIIMAHGIHVVGIQHYSMAKLLLVAHNPYLPRVGLDSIKRRREADQEVVHLLRTIIGLALSNLNCLNASFTACHALHTCGFWFQDNREQSEAIDFLLKVETRIGWRTESIISSLKDHWGL